MFKSIPTDFVTVPFIGLLVVLIFNANGTSADELDDLTGAYRLDVVENPWHVGKISRKPNAPGMLEWRNDAGIVWNLIPDLNRNVLRTDATNPYFEEGIREFKLLREDGRVVGFVFQSDTFRRSDDFIGEYQLEKISNDWHTGKISRKANSDKFEWRNSAGIAWTLTPDLRNNVLRTDETNPYAKDGVRDFQLLRADNKIVGFVFKSETYFRKGYRRLTQKFDGLHGYIAANIATPPDGFGYGVSFYANNWQLLEKPLDQFQIGLPSTWIIPDNRGFQQPLCPPGTVARDSWPERGPIWADVFQTIEGGLGFWANEQYLTSIPKYRMNGTPSGYNYEVSSPGWAFGGGKDRNALKANEMGIAQLSNRLLVPPDGFTFDKDKYAGLLGNAWMVLPLVDPQPSPVAPTGGNCWTLFFNAANFSGPVAFWIPETWSRLSKGYPVINGRGLDARPASMNGGAMEINTVPYFEAQDSRGKTYTRIPKLKFPANDQGEAILMQDVVMYSPKALFDPMKSGLAASRLGNGAFKIGTTESFVPRISAAPMHFTQGPNKKILKGVENKFRTEVFQTASSSAFGLKWTDLSNNGVFPEYFRLDGDELTPVSATDVPDETQLKTQSFRPAQAGEMYVSPNDRNGVWRNPGAASGPIELTLSDGSFVLYSWYRFVDQPSIQALNWSAEKKRQIQANIEQIHRSWPINGRYMPAPSRGTLVSLDGKLIVTPPAGLEVGYVPIVTKQASSKNADPSYRRQ